MTRLLTSAVLVAAMITCARPAIAQEVKPPVETPPPEDEDDGWGDDDGDDDITIDDSELELDGPRALSLTGFFRSDWGFWAERFDGEDQGNGRSAWAKGRQSLDLVLTGKQDFFRFILAGHFEYDTRYLGDEHGLTTDFDDATGDAYAWQLLPREALMGFSLGRFDLTIGYQIVAWGEGDAFSVVDVVNPRDMREPGLADLDDIRMSVLATRLGFFIGDHRIEAMVLHEANFGLRSPPFGPFSPLPALVGTLDTPLPLDQIFAGKQVRFVDAEPRFALDQQQPLLRWVYKGPGIDLGAYAAYVMDKQGTIALPDPAAILDPTAKTVDLTLEHPFYTVLGTSGAWAWESLLVKWEAGTQLQRSFNVEDNSGGVPSLGTEEATTIDAMVGLTYTPFTDLMLGLEFSKSTFINEPDGLLFPADLPFTAFRLSYRLLKERLRLAAAFSMFGLTTADEIGFLARAEANYELRDGFKLGLGYVHYFPSEDLGPASGLGDHDQLFFKLRWDFTLL